MGIDGKNVMKLVISARDNTRGAFTKVGVQINTMKGRTTGLNTGMKGLKGTMANLTGAAGKLAGAIGPLGLAGVAIGAVAAVGLFASSAVKSFTAFEDSMANVRKTTGMTKEETDALGESIDKLALRLPVAHEELAKIAAIAGQLGIQGEENILRFTEDIAKMSTAFDMSAESAATAMAKMSNIYDIPIENISALGSAINVLGNTTAAQESAIMDFSMSLGASAKQLGFCETEAVAMGATLISMGMDASASGTRLNAAFTQMAQNLDKVSLFLGISEDKFRDAFGKDPMGMITKIVTKLAQIEDPLERAAAGAEMFGRIGAKSINALGGDLDGLQTNLTNAAKGFEENISLTEEFAAKTDTLKAKFALVSNAAESFKINIGAALAPLAGALAEGAINTINNISVGFNALQKVVSAIHSVFEAFFDGIQKAVLTALKPLTDMLQRNAEEVNKLNVVFEVFSNILIIVREGAKKLGIVIGTFLAKALTPFVAKIQEAIKVLTDFYNKLGPIKGLVDGIKDKIGGAVSAIEEWADSFEETVQPAEELTEAVEELTTEAEKLGPVLTESIKTLGSRLTEASGSYKTAISNITKEIDTLKDAWNLASGDQKEAIEKQISSLKDVRNELKMGEDAQKKYFDATIDGAKEAITKQEEFKIQIGKTTITFKDMAAEVVKNADAYVTLKENADALLKLDWSVFVALERALPDISDGIGDMKSAFQGLQVVLEENIDNLENIKSSVEKIGDIAAPFLEAGFLDGIKAIGSFAGALSDAGSAINTFGNLQDVSIKGCAKFSLRVNDMVTALTILENQMGDLVPAFGEMDSLISDISESFVYSGGKKASFAEDLISDISALRSAVKTDLLGANKSIDEFVNHIKNLEKEHKEWALSTSWETAESASRFGATSKKMENAAIARHALLEKLKYEYGLSYAEAHKIMLKYLAEGEKGYKEFASTVLDSGNTIAFQIDKQTNALKLQGDQLTKITDALAPYFSFMDSIAELTDLTTLSTEDLNSGFTSIQDTIMNLSTALESFDLESAMSSLFGSEAEDAASRITDTMIKYEAEFESLLAYIERLSTSITVLVDAFDSLTELEESTVAVTTVIEVFQDLTRQLKDSARTVENEVKKIVGSIFTNFSMLREIKNNMYAYGASGIIAFATGMNAYAYVLERVLQNMANMIKAYLGVKSPTEKGPLKALSEWPRNLVKTFSEGINAEMSTLNASFTGMTLLTPANSSGGNRTSIVFNVTQKITDKATADYSTRELERMINRHEML